MTKLNKVKKLVDDLFFDYDRLSLSGQETLDKLGDLLGIEEATDEELLAMGLPKDKLQSQRKAYDKLGEILTDALNKTIEKENS